MLLFSIPPETTAFSLIDLFWVLLIVQTSIVGTAPMGIIGRRFLIKYAVLKKFNLFRTNFNTWRHLKK